MNATSEVKVPFFVDLHNMKRLGFLLILLIYNVLWAGNIPAQNPDLSGIRLARITYLASNLDSLTRSYIKRGYTIKQGKRDADGIFSNSILLSDGSEIILEATLSTDPNDWHNIATKKYGTHAAGIAFEVEDIDSLYQLLQRENIPLGGKAFIKQYRNDETFYIAKAFALDSCAPLDVVFYAKDTAVLHSPEFDSLSHHSNHVYRFDWVLLSAGISVERNLRSVFEVISTWKLHEGCCDFWRVGPADDFCFFRFEPPLKKNIGINNWLSIEPDNIYFAY